MLKSDHKVPGGKMVRVRMEVKGEKIERIQICGDFFLYPEEALPKLEELLRGVKTEEEDILNRIKEAYRRLGIVSLGVDPREFAVAIMKALKERDRL
ncbi:MAG: lipoate protein ligase C-terminal domain-containing protein [Candidatus Bathyarchaeia archaeon]